MVQFPLYYLAGVPAFTMGNIHEFVVSGSFNWSRLKEFLLGIRAAFSSVKKDYALNLQDLSFISPEGMVIIVGTVELLKSQGFRLKEIVRPQGAVASYLERMAFYQALDEPNFLNYNRKSPTGRFLELTKINSVDDCCHLAGDLARVFVQQTEGDEDAGNGVELVLSEVLENAFHHGGGILFPLVCCQSYQKTFSIALGDFGVGIEESMKDSQRGVDAAKDFGPLTAALQKGVTRRPSANAGLGLFFTSELIRQNKGTLRIQSRNRSLQMSGGADPKEDETVWRWPGTIISLEFHSDRPLDINSILDANPVDEDFF